MLVHIEKGKKSLKAGLFRSAASWDVSMNLLTSELECHKTDCERTKLVAKEVGRRVICTGFHDNACTNMRNSQLLTLFNTPYSVRGSQYISRYKWRRV